MRVDDSGVDRRHDAYLEAVRDGLLARGVGFLTVLSDGEHLTGAYELGPEAGEWLQQATLAIRARVPLEVLRDTIQPFPSFSEIHAAALKALRQEIAAGRRQVGLGAG
jgi:pyruvate/2-oxoglutarate dehydrogenase complex dihydrolipoamide dehydrogenase (E3) component